MESATSLEIEYTGTFNIEIVDSFLTTIFDKLQETEKNIKTRKLTYHVCVELIQNLQRYLLNSTTLDKSNNKIHLNIGKFSLRSLPDTYYQVSTTNYVTSGIALKLENHFSDLKKLSQEELNKLYNSVLLDKMFNEKGGASLGLIDVYRKVSDGINYELEPINEQYSKYSLTVSIPTQHK